MVKTRTKLTAHSFAIWKILNMKCMQLLETEINWIFWTCVEKIVKSHQVNFVSLNSKEWKSIRASFRPRVNRSIYRTATRIITKLLICGICFFSKSFFKTISYKLNFSFIGLEPNNLKAQADLDLLECEINGPDGDPVEADVSKLGPDGLFQVR